MQIDTGRWGTSGGGERGSGDRRGTDARATQRLADWAALSGELARPPATGWAEAGVAVLALLVLLVPAVVLGSVTGSWVLGLLGMAIGAAFDAALFVFAAVSAAG